MRDLKQGGGTKKDDIVVWIRGGRYYLKDTVVFGLQDSAEAGQTITYGAYPGEEPIFGSGVRIEGWQELGGNLPEGLPHMSLHKVWVADVPSDLGPFRTLYDGDRRLPRARTDGFNPTTRRLRRTEPPPGEFKLGQGDMTDFAGVLDPLRHLGFPEGAVKNWDNLEDVELVIRFGYAMAILPLESVDEEWRIATTAAQSGYVLKATGGFVDTGETIASIENVPEGLTYPGEWVLNSKEKKLYLWPVGDEPGDEIFAPSLMELIRVEGDIDIEGPTDTPVRGIVFEGISFTQGDRYVVSDDDMSIQHDWAMIDQGHGLLRLRGAEECRIENCRFFNSGGEAIRLDLHCQRNVVTRNEIDHLGCSGILLLGYGPGTKDVNKNNEIVNNHLHHLGEIYWHSHGIILHQSAENRVAHNYIHHMPRKAICLCGVRPQFFIPEEAYNVLNMRECAPCIRWHEIEDPGGGAEGRERLEGKERDRLAAGHAVPAHERQRCRVQRGLPREPGLRRWRDHQHLGRGRRQHHPAQLRAPHLQSAHRRRDPHRRLPAQDHDRGERHLQDQLLRNHPQARDVCGQQRGVRCLSWLLPVDRPAAHRRLERSREMSSCIPGK